MLPKQSLKRIIFAFVFLVTPLLTFTSQKSFAQAGDIPTDAETISAGENLFNQNCKVCHNIDTKL
ncbi:MAG: cytochrome c, partial [Flavobacteriaceae bacterium]|nr:cytochrome c [Flavobacteriaceae bacterium]